MIKRWIAGLLACAAALSLSACQSTPTQSVVTGKDNRVFQAFASGSRGRGGAQTERSGIFACKAASRSYGRACFTD